MPESSEVVLDAEDKVRRILQNEALFDSNTKGKSTYTTCVSYFTEGAGVKTSIVLEAMVAFWLSWYVLPCGLEDEIHPYVFSLAVKLAKGEQLAPALIFLGSLFFRLDECAQSRLKSMGRYTVVFYANSAFLQLFLWERFKSLAPQPVQFEAVNMVTSRTTTGLSRQS